jgi:tyrosinase
MHANPLIDRRRLMATSLGALAAVLLDRGVGLRAQTPPVRREVHDPAAAPMLALYKRAIKEMKTRPVWDPTSWWFQAALHWTPVQNDAFGCYELACFNQLFQPPAGAGPDVLARIAASRRLVAGDVPIDPSIGIGRDRIWVKCPHRTYDFLPWHRVYLFFFERIIENVVGEPFGLPYWNYLDTRFRDFPPPFRPARESDGSDNPLFYPDRSPLCRDPNDASVPAAEKPLIRDQDLNWPTAAEQRFLERGDVLGLDRGFSFQLESAPHDQVHGRIGIVVGATPFGMATPALAARDPIFYLHHSNLDRLWEWWRTQPAGPEDPLRDPNYIWTQEPYLFATADIHKTGFTARESLGMVSRFYAYDTLDPVAAPPPGPVAAVARAQAASAAPTRVGRSGPLTVAGAPASTQLAPTPQAPAASERRDAAAPAASRWFLRLASLDSPSGAGVFDIYLDPPGAASTEGAPAGSFSLFGTPEGALAPHAGHGATATGNEKVIEVTPRMRQLIERGVNPAEVRITVVPNRSSGASTVRIGLMELFSR